MKGLIAVAMLGLLAGCANLNLLKSPAPDNWTTWVCDSQAQVVWRYTDSSRKEVMSLMGY